MASPSSSDWASLSINFLDSILDYLVPMEDYLTFGEVCIKWQYAVREKLEHLRSNHKLHCRLHQQVPLLMAPSADNPRERCCLYDVMKGGIWEVQSRLLGRWRYEGSSHGWLILVDLDSYKVTLYNPFSGKLIHLPPLEKSIFLKCWDGVYRAIFPYKARRGVLSVDPDVNRDEFVLMMTCGFVKGLAFIRSGEEDWTYIKELQYVEDIVYSNGLFYVLDGWGVLFSCDVSNDSKVRRITSLDIRPALPLVSYLVESPEGDLLRVIKHEGGVVIYKLQWFPKNEEVMSLGLGDVALFLGDNHSISVRASDFAGCRPNSIYFCQRHSMLNPLDGSAYVFSLDDGTVTPLYPYSQQPLLWISPKFV
ncbi:hypothetical protein PVL29_020277 [Vitis rotundifolia]|uniref:KIB1-4 beta-propeller domain-containing protein n=1 Tax=Vitis rotundifolia TaxID=103349 RepID=A0AA38Z326_VITRO|nr:hypothetical protein PVL29_020277 [Vitis rotundifolia]